MNELSIEQIKFELASLRKDFYKLRKKYTDRIPAELFCDYFISHTCKIVHECAPSPEEGFSFILTIVNNTLKNKYE